jgi:hypothetical protein
VTGDREKITTDKSRIIKINSCVFFQVVYDLLIGFGIAYGVNNYGKIKIR